MRKRINESMLNRIVKESVKKILKEDLGTNLVKKHEMNIFSMLEHTKQLIHEESFYDAKNELYKVISLLDKMNNIDW